MWTTPALTTSLISPANPLKATNFPLPYVWPPHCTVDSSHLPYFDLQLGTCLVLCKKWWTICRDSLLYRGSEDDDEFGLEVTGWAWNKRTRTKMMMTVTRMRVKGSIIGVKLRLWGVDKRTVWGLFAEFKRPYILNTGGPCALFRAGNTIGDRCNDTIYGSMSQVES